VAILSLEIRMYVTIVTMGSIGVSQKEVLLKITKKLVVVISEEEFLDNFSKEENYVWSILK